MHQDPKNWRLGVFYYNTKDTRLFVPKRHENKWNSGSTANFAHPVTYLLFLPVMLLPMIILAGYAIKS
ncbi:hypothetical protein CNR22_19045 [Sphingobacteriaceae bacterium]|nr:hypothetical protein CNR22_19045 [Sphingobacteriaceae bacterium]